MLREKLFEAGTQHEVVWSRAKNWQEQLLDHPTLGAEHERLPFVQVPIGVPVDKLPKELLASFCGQLRIEGDHLGCEVVTGQEVLQQLRLSDEKHEALIEQMRGEYEGFVLLRARQNTEVVVFCSSLEEALASRQESLKALKKAQEHYQQLEERVTQMEERGQEASRACEPLRKAGEAVQTAERQVSGRAFLVVPSLTAEQQAALQELVKVLQQQTQDHRTKPLLRIVEGLAVLLGDADRSTILKNGRALQEMLKNELEEELILGSSLIPWPSAF